MAAQEKQTYTQVKDRYETLRQVAREVVHDGLGPVMPNKRGAAILKNDISLDGLTFQCQNELRKWENTGLRRVVWDWDVVQKNIGLILNALNYRYGIKTFIYVVRA